MSAQEVRRQEAAGQSEVERLKKELAALRQRLNDDVAYYRAESETARQRVEAEQLRIHAQEVARRRKLEEELASVTRKLQEAQEHNDRLQRRYDDLHHQYLQQQETARLSAEDQVAQTREAARDAWQSAEQELASMEGQLNDARLELAREQERSRQLEETLGTLQGVEGQNDEDREAALLDEVTALRKALNLSERGRGQANQRAVRLAEKLVALQTAQERSSPSAAVQSQESRQAGSRFGAGNPVQVDLTEANAVLRAAHGDESRSGDGDEAVLSLGAELADEFLLIEADNSLDRSKLQRMQEQVDKEDQRQAQREQEQAAERRARATPAVAQPAPQQKAPVSRTETRSRSEVPEAAASGSGTRRWPTAVALVVLLGGVGAGLAWFLGLIG